MGQLEDEDYSLLPVLPLAWPGCAVRSERHAGSLMCGNKNQDSWGGLLASEHF